MHKFEIKYSFSPRECLFDPDLHFPKKYFNPIQDELNLYPGLLHLSQMTPDVSYYYEFYSLNKTKKKKSLAIFYSDSQELIIENKKINPIDVIKQSDFSWVQLKILKYNLSMLESSLFHILLSKGAGLESIHTNLEKIKEVKLSPHHLIKIFKKI